MNDYIDTKTLSTVILKELGRHSISQKLFARKVIFRSQGTLSELLHKPKKWEALSTNGRKNYVALRDWLHTPLPDRVQKLYLKDDEKVVKPKSNRKRGPANPNVDGNNVNPVKNRLVFSDQQKNVLARVFAECTTPTYQMKQIVAEHLNLEISTVNNYFMNARRRQKEKEEQAGGDMRAPRAENLWEGGEEENVTSEDVHLEYEELGAIKKEEEGPEDVVPKDVKEEEDVEKEKKPEVFDKYILAKYHDLVKQ